MITAVTEATVPKVCVIVRKAYGAGLYAMSGPAFDPIATLALPTAKIAVMGPEPAVNAVYANKIAAIADEAERAAFVAERRAEYEEDVDLLHLASELVVDAVVDFDRVCAKRSCGDSRRPTDASGSSSRSATACRRCDAGRALMPWCDDCSKFWNPNSMPADGTCPTCGRKLAASSAPAASAVGSTQGRSQRARRRRQDAVALQAVGRRDRALSRMARVPGRGVADRTVRLASSAHGLWRSLVSALDWGSRGREFKSPQPDQSLCRSGSASGYQIAEQLGRLVTDWSQRGVRSQRPRSPHARALQGSPRRARSCAVSELSSAPTR